MSLSQAMRPGSTTSLAMKIRCTPRPDHHGGLLSVGRGDSPGAGSELALEELGRHRGLAMRRDRHTRVLSRTAASPRCCDRCAVSRRTATGRARVAGEDIPALLSDVLARRVPAVALTPLVVPSTMPILPRVAAVRRQRNQTERVAFRITLPAPKENRDATKHDHDRPGPHPGRPLQPARADRLHRGRGRTGGLPAGRHPARRCRRTDPPGAQQRARRARGWRRQRARHHQCAGLPHRHLAVRGDERGLRDRLLRATPRPNDGLRRAARPGCWWRSTHSR